MLWEDALGALCSEIQTPQDTFSYGWKECTGHPKSVMAPLLEMPAAQQTVFSSALNQQPLNTYNTGCETARVPPPVQTTSAANSMPLRGSGDHIMKCSLYENSTCEPCKIKMI